MREREPITKIVKASEARQQFSQLLNQVFRRDARVIVEKSGVPVAAIVSAEDLERLNQMDKQRAERFKIIDEMREAFRDVPDEELEEEVARAVAEARLKQREKMQRQAKSA